MRTHWIPEHQSYFLATVEQLAQNSCSVDDGNARARPSNDDAAGAQINDKAR